MVAARTWQRHGRILLVEDNDLVRRFAVVALETEGHAVTAVASPREALDLLADSRAQFELLVTDVVMPGLDGRKLADRVLELAPGIGVLFISGYPETETLRPVIGAAATRRLAKPFRAAQLNEAVAELLVWCPETRRELS